jgi:hypothetical protein
VYSFTGIDTGVAESVSVEFFRMQTPMASQEFAAQFTEKLKDQLQQQSPLSLVDQNGDLNYQGSIVNYRVNTAAVQSNETASYNRLTVTVKLSYTNTLEKEKSFDKSFTEYADFDSSQDLIDVEQVLWDEIMEKLVQSIYNDSLGNW